MKVYVLFKEEVETGLREVLGLYKDEENCYIDSREWDRDYNCQDFYFKWEEFDLK